MVYNELSNFLIDDVYADRNNQKWIKSIELKERISNSSASYGCIFSTKVSR